MKSEDGGRATALFERAVVTLCDANYYPGLLGLHASIQSSEPCPVVCFDAGLTAEQREDAAARGNLHLRSIPNDPLIEQVVSATQHAAPLKKNGKRIWPLWICPLLIRAVPARDVFWLDCDLLVLRGLSELFAMLGDGPVFTPENLAPHLTPNKPQLYRYLPIARAFDPAVPAVNAGVSGWRRGRDDAALEAYIRPVAAAMRNSAIREAISWHDQGALIWAIQSLGLEHRVVSDTSWNLCIGNAGVSVDMLAWNEGLIERLRAALPHVRILHWNGHPAPWAS